eukprot:3712745-Prymnesium_polylepis.2
MPPVSGVSCDSRDWGACIGVNPVLYPRPWCVAISQSLVRGPWPVVVALAMLSAAWDVYRNRIRNPRRERRAVTPKGQAREQAGRNPGGSGPFSRRHTRGGAIGATHIYILCRGSNATSFMDPSTIPSHLLMRHHCYGLWPMVR